MVVNCWAVGAVSFIMPTLLLSNHVLYLYPIDIPDPYQVNLDFSSEEDMVKKFQVGLALQPVSSNLMLLSSAILFT